MKKNTKTLSKLSNTKLYYDNDYNEDLSTIESEGSLYMPSLNDVFNKAFAYNVHYEYAELIDDILDTDSQAYDNCIYDDDNDSDIDCKDEQEDTVHVVVLYNTDEDDMYSLKRTLISLYKTSLYTHRKVMVYIDVVNSEDNVPTGDRKQVIDAIYKWVLQYKINSMISSPSTFIISYVDNIVTTTLNKKKHSDLKTHKEIREISYLTKRPDKHVRHVEISFNMVFKDDKMTNISILSSRQDVKHEERGKKNIMKKQQCLDNNKNRKIVIDDYDKLLTKITAGLKKINQQLGKKVINTDVICLKSGTVVYDPYSFTKIYDDAIEYQSVFVNPHLYISPPPYKTERWCRKGVKNILDSILDVSKRYLFWISWFLSYVSYQLFTVITTMANFRSDLFYVMEIRSFTTFIEVISSHYKSKMSDRQQRHVNENDDNLDHDYNQNHYKNESDRYRGCDNEKTDVKLLYHIFPKMFSASLARYYNQGLKRFLFQDQTHPAKINMNNHKSYSSYDRIVNADSDYTLDSDSDDDDNDDVHHVDSKRKINNNQDSDIIRGGGIVYCRNSEKHFKDQVGNIIKHWAMRKNACIIFFYCFLSYFLWAMLNVFGNHAVWFIKLLSTLDIISSRSVTGSYKSIFNCFTDPVYYAYTIQIGWMLYIFMILRGTTIVVKKNINPLKRKENSDDDDDHDDNKKIKGVVDSDSCNTVIFRLSRFAVDVCLSIFLPYGAMFVYIILIIFRCLFVRLANKTSYYNIRNRKSFIPIQKLKTHNKNQKKGCFVSWYRRCCCCCCNFCEYDVSY